jgi:hypothetical protein
MNDLTQLLREADELRKARLADEKRLRRIQLLLNSLDALK